jgi:hypothetical protein
MRYLPRALHSQTQKHPITKSISWVNFNPHDGWKIDPGESLHPHGHAPAVPDEQANGQDGHLLAGRLAGVPFNWRNRARSAALTLPAGGAAAVFWFRSRSKIAQRRFAPLPQFRASRALPFEARN